MKKYLLVVFLFVTTSLFCQVNPEVRYIKLFDDSVRVVFDSTKIKSDFMNVARAKYFSSVENVFAEIETRGQAALDDIGKEKLWFVPKSLADSIQTILDKHNLIVRWRHSAEGYKKYEYLEEYK